MIQGIPPSISVIQSELTCLLESGLMIPVPEGIESMEFAIQMTTEGLHAVALWMWESH